MTDFIRPSFLRLVPSSAVMMMHEDQTMVCNMRHIEKCNWATEVL